MTPTPVEQRLRAFCRALALLISLATAVELWLVEHTHGFVQWVPFILCAALAGSVTLVTVRPAPAPLRIHRVVMVLVLLGAGYGLYSHFAENMAFARDIRPTAQTREIVIAGFTGASPLMASGILAVGAALGAAGTYGLASAGRHRDASVPWTP